MATYYNGVQLDQFGVIGEPSIEYAAFDATTKTTEGMDGSVLTGRNRSETSISFSVGIEAEREDALEKLSGLLRTLGNTASTGRLSMPGQDNAKTYFNAYPNAAVAPNQYHNGFIAKLKFIVPDGCAWRVGETAEIKNGNVEYIAVGGVYDAEWTASIELPANTLICHLSFSNFGGDDLMELDYRFPNALTKGGTLSIDSKTRTSVLHDNAEDTDANIAPTLVSFWPALAPGYVSVYFRCNTENATATISFNERVVW